jgi:hypothetical protein
MDTPQQSAAQYDAIMADIGAVGRLPAGCLAHVAGPAPDGAWRVVAVWEDEERFQAFITGTLAPARDRAGVPAPTSPPLVWPLHNLLLNS